MTACSYIFPLSLRSLLNVTNNTGQPVASGANTLIRHHCDHAFSGRSSSPVLLYVNDSDTQRDIPCFDVGEIGQWDEVLQYNKSNYIALLM